LIFQSNPSRWGRGHPEEYTQAMHLGVEDRYESMDSDKKPRAGQILWIRGLTRLQTQVSGPLSVLHHFAEKKNILYFSIFF
jgi:hypothetical protein